MQLSKQPKMQHMPNRKWVECNIKFCINSCQLNYTRKPLKIVILNLKKHFTVSMYEYG